MRHNTRLAGWLLVLAGAGLCLGGEGSSAKEPKERAKRDAHGEVLCMAITPDGETLATGTAQEHLRRTSSWPNEDSGPVAAAAGETWSAIDLALRYGHRGLPGNSSLARLVGQRRG